MLKQPSLKRKQTVIFKSIIKGKKLILQWYQLDTLLKTQSEP